MEDVQDKGFRIALLAESNTQTHCKAIYWEVRQKLRKAEKILYRDVKALTDQDRLYWLARGQALREILELPEANKEILEKIEKENPNY